MIKEVNTLELLISETEKALNNECLFAALSLLLIIPDICGKILYTNLSKVHDSKTRYIKWCDEYIKTCEKPNFNDNNLLPYLNGELIYKLRCGYLHSGSTVGITKKYQDFNLDEFVLIVESKKTFDIYGDVACSINGKTGYELNIRRLAIIILSGAKNTLKKLKDEQIECETIKVKDYDEECLQRRIINEKNNSLINNHPIVHNMKLYSNAFYYIKEQNKRVELRLDDEKRQKLRVGDYIEFVAVNTNEKILVKITKLNHFKNFNDLYDAYPNKIVLGYKEGEAASPNDMLDYYKIEDINLYGALAIEFEVLNK